MRYNINDFGYQITAPCYNGAMNKGTKMPTSFRLDDKTRAALSVLCEETHRKAGDMVKHALLEQVKALGLENKVQARIEGGE